MKQPIVLLILFLLCSSLATASTIGINRPSVDFDNVLVNGYAQETIILSTNSQEEKKLILEVSQGLDEMVMFTKEEEPITNITISNNNPQQIIVVAQPANELVDGLHEGTINIRELTQQDTNQDFITTTQKALAIPLRVHLTDKETTRCVLGGVNVPSIEEGQELSVTYSIRNTGNTQINPVTEMIIQDQEQTTNLFEETTNQETTIRATSNQRFEQTNHFDQTPGQYWLTINVPSCNETRTLTFDIVPPGTIADRGELVSVTLNQEPTIDEVTAIDATFRNRGEQTVTAQLQATITHQETGTTTNIESDELLVRSAQTQTLRGFFTPTKQGTYEVTTRVRYNEKITYQETKNFQIINGQETTSSIPNVQAIISALIFVTIITLLVLLIQKKKRINNKKKK